MDKARDKGYIREGQDIKVGTVSLNRKPLLTDKGRNTMIIRKITLIGLIVGFLMVYPNGVSWIQAQEKSQDKQKQEKVQQLGTITHVIIGKIASFSPRNSPIFIGITVDERDDHFFKIDENVSTSRNKDITDLVLGDMVSITYDEINELKKDGTIRNIRIAKVIKYISPAIKGLRSGQ